MTDAIVLLANEIQDKDEQIDRLTAERDSFKACYDISFQEASRLRISYDRIRTEYANIQRELYLAKVALQKSHHHTATALGQIAHEREAPPSVVVFNRGGER
jgi:uncharacterized coiled-coil DUF342 family protein